MPRPDTPPTASVSPSQPSPAARARDLGTSLVRRSDFNVVIATVGLFLLLTIVSDSFLSSYNLFNVSRTASLYVFIAMGQAIPLVVGGMNLSLGYIGGLSVVFAGVAMQDLGLDPIIAFPISLIVGVICGLVNGLLITRLNINSFVVTLATGFVFAGLISGISRGFPYTEIPSSISIIGRQSLFGFSWLLILMIITMIFVGYFFRYRVTGRRLLATGGNEEAAKLSGVRSDLIILIAFVLSGIFAAIGGFLWVSRLGSAQPSIGSDWLIISFAVAIIGGTSLKGGQFSAVGIVASAFLLTFIKNGLVMLNVNVYYEQTFLGLVILLAVSIESLRAIARRYARRSVPARKAGVPA
jgi:ribose transport system permease protein